jgi:enoyl-CoA hydratase/carnithine racemase
MATMCDMRICGASSRFGVPINRLGLVVSYEELRGLVALAGKAGTLEILLEGRVFGAEEALQKGLVNRFVADEDVAAEVAVRRQAHQPGRAAGGALAQEVHQPHAAGTPLTTAELDEAHLCFDTEDFRIGRKPSWKRPSRRSSGADLRLRAAYERLGLSPGTGGQILPGRDPRFAHPVDEGGDAHVAPNPGARGKTM